MSSGLSQLCRMLVGIIAILFLLWCLLPLTGYAEEKVLNMYVWSGEVPDAIVRQFEKETGIKVNFATYDNNEIMYTKLRTRKNAGYDLVIPSSYFVDRMRKQHMLTALDKSKLPNWHYLNPKFLNPAYDPGAQYSMPYLWGVTGIFYNKKAYPDGSIKGWNDLWDPRYQNQLMLLDDTREIFSIGLLALGYSPNDTNPEHIHQAYLKLKTLMNNVKVFSSDTVVSIIIDEDASLGTAWNGDAFKAQQENPDIKFVYPKEGFVIWVDNFAIPKGAPHPNNAYAFLNFIMRPDIGEKIVLATRYPTTNLAARQLLPEKIRQNPVAYPPDEVLKRGIFQTDLGESTLALYEKYWEQLKMGG